MTARDDNLQYRLRSADKELYQEIYNIAIREGRSSSYKDFPSINHGTFRNGMLRLRKNGLIEKVYQSSLAFYKPTGVSILTDKVSLTNHMGGKTFGQLLEELNFKDPAIHDIRLCFQAPRLYTSLLLNGSLSLTPNPVSKDIKLPPIRFENKTRAVYITAHISGTVSIQIACSEYPVQIYDSPLLSFYSMLGEVKAFLQSVQPSEGIEIKIPDPTSWILSHCHLGRDSIVSIEGERFNITLSEATGQFMRIYVKKFNDRRQKLRIEESIAPQKPLLDAIREKLYGNGQHR